MVATAPPAATQSGWSSLFWEAFKRSQNAMVLLDGERRHVEANGAYLELLGYRRRDLIGRPIYDFVVGGPLYSPATWRAAIAQEDFSGTARLRRADGTTVTVQFAGHAEAATGQRRVLVVALGTARGGRRLPDEHPHADERLSDREREVVRLVACGSNGPEIAEQLRISHNTVRTHVSNAMNKVGARSRAHLVAKALGDGITL